ncbi:DNA primase [Kribbella aluminosa]|uniref:DNA primase n=1 Tax=Kribbella aluminosa TaxID=416017 RepID=A0ABS4UJG7_9ACTN|nr:DNA primase [Kribbella aluminosa]
MGGQDRGLSMDERRRMVEANAAAAQYFRRELLRATGGWPLEYLRAYGAESVLSPASAWRVGYAPQAWSDLVDRLQERGFSLATLARAGLLVWNEHGDAAGP